MTNRLKVSAALTLVPDTVVDTISIPLVRTMRPDGTTDITATFSTAGGRPLDLAPDSWELDDEVNFSLVDNLDGTCTITSTIPDVSTVVRAIRGVKTSNECAIVCSLVSGGPNEPEGMTMLVTHDGSAVQPNAAWDYSVGQVSIETDDELGDVLQLEMSPVTTPGSGSAVVNAGSVWANPVIAAFAPTEVYLSWYQKLSAGFKNNDGAGGEKNIWINMQLEYALRFWGIELGGLVDVDSDIAPHFDLYGCVAGNGNTFSERSFIAGLRTQDHEDYLGDIMPRAVWKRHEVRIVFPARNTPNGSVQYWLDEVAYPMTDTIAVNAVIGLAATGLQLVGDYGPRMTSLGLVNVWGGGGSVVASTNTSRFKDFYLSAKYARDGEEPNNWVIALADGEDSTPAAGTKVLLVAQLVDGNGDSVDVFGPTLSPTLHHTGSGTPARYSTNHNYTDPFDTATLVAADGAAENHILSGNYYTIAVVGTTDFTLIGAASNTVGLTFLATGTGTGTGTATVVPRSGNFDIKTIKEVTYTNLGTSKTLPANTVFDTGTTATIAATKWNAALLAVDDNENPVLTWADAGGGASYASEAAAIAALPTAPPRHTGLGYVTVQAGASTWTPGTSALATGTGGTPANATNYSYLNDHFTREIRGTVLIRVDVDGGATPGADIAITMDDYALTNNGTTNGTHRTSNTLHLTVS